MDNTKKFDPASLQKKGQAQISGKMTSLVGALVVIVLATALAPTMFENVSILGNDSNVPAWVSTVLVVIIGAGIVFLIWKLF